MADATPKMRVQEMLQDPEFRALPPERREAMMKYVLEQATPPATPTPRSPALAQEQQQAAQTPPALRGLQAVSQASPEIALYAPQLPQIEQAAQEMTPEERTQLRAQQFRAERGGVAGTISTAGSALGAALGAPLGPWGMVGGEMFGSGLAYGANVALGLDDPSWLNLGLNVGLPAVWPAVKAAASPFAKSSRVGQTAIRDIDERNYTSYLERRSADITQVEDANTAIRQAHDAAQAARQAEIDRLTALNTAAKQQHGTLEQAVKEKNAAGWKVRQDAIDARQLEIDRIKADNAQAASAYEASRTMALEERAGQEQMNTDAKLRHDAVVQAQQANYARLKEANTRLADRITRRTDRLNLAARAAQAANPERARTMMAQMPDIPTKDTIDEMYDTLDGILHEHNIELKVPEYRAAQAKIKQWAEGTSKMPHGPEFEQKILEYTRGLETDEPLTLREMVNGTSFLGNQVRLLRKRASTGAGDSLLVNEELAAAVKLYQAMDESLLAAAKQSSITAEMRAQLLDAREAYKRRATFDDLTDFFEEITTRNPRTGEEILNPIAGLKKLDTPAYAVTKRFLQQTPVDPNTPGGTTMYDKTVESLTKMIPQQMTVQDRVLWYAQLKATGDPTGKLYDITPPPSREIVAPPIPQRPPIPAHAMTQVPPKGAATQQPVPEPLTQLGRGDYLPGPKPPALQPVPAPLPHLNEALLARVPDRPPSWAAQAGAMPPIRQGPIATAAGYLPAAVMGAGGMMLDKYLPGGMETALGLGVGLGLATRASLAAVMMKPQGQDFLVKLIEGRGLRLDPVMTGMLNAAVRQGVSYGLPLDATGQP